MILLLFRQSHVGKVKIIVKVHDSKDSIIIKSDRSGFNTSSRVCLAEDIFIEREWDSWKLNEENFDLH